MFKMILSIILYSKSEDKTIISEKIKKFADLNCLSSYLVFLQNFSSLASLKPSTNPLSKSDSENFSSAAKRSVRVLQKV